MALELPSQELLRERLAYDPETGILTWAYSRPGITKGKVVGHPNRHGRGVQVMLDRKSYRAHRLIWKWMTGDDPDREIDHINQDRHDNRWENLRLAHAGAKHTTVQGWAYKKGVRKSTCGITFEAAIRVDGKKFHLGCYKTEDEAHQAYCEAAEVLHREFSCIASKSKVSSKISD